MRTIALQLNTGDFLELIETTESLTILQTRMSKIGLILGEDFRTFMLSESFANLDNKEKAEVVRNIYGEKALSYIKSSIPHTEFLATKEAKENGLVKNITIPAEPIHFRLKEVVGASLHSIISQGNYAKGSLTLKDGIEQSFLLPSRTLAPLSIGAKKAMRLIAQSDACNYCQRLSNIAFPLGSKQLEQFHDSCRCVVKTIY